jgi:hypothetical protein
VTFIQNADGQYIRIDNASLLFVNPSGGNFQVYKDSQTANNLIATYDTEPEAVAAVEAIVAPFGVVAVPGTPL